MLAVARQLARFDVPLIGVNQGRLGLPHRHPDREHGRGPGTDPRGPPRRGTAHAARGGRASRRRRPGGDRARAERGRRQPRHVGRDDRHRGRDRRPLRLRDALGRAHRRDADRLDRVRALGAGTDRRSAGPRAAARPGRAARAHQPPDRRSATRRRSASRLLRGSDAWAHCDGHAHFQLSEGDSVEIRRSAHLVRLLHPEGHDHFAMLREKLHWSETPERVRP